MKSIRILFGAAMLLGLGTPLYCAEPRYLNAEPANIVPLYVNQTGYDTDQPKRMTAPMLADSTEFIIRSAESKAAVFTGKITGHIADFSAFRPAERGTFFIEAGGMTSVPFVIAPWWIERVSYQNSINFLIASRHYTGDVKKKIPESFGWRDDHFFAFEVNVLVAQYLSNPAAYERMPRQITYVKPEGDQTKIWGALEPCSPDAPDIIKLIHWGADCIVTQQLSHELLKGQLAHFLYAYPYMKQYIPESAYRKVLQYAIAKWPEDHADRKYKYDEAKHHDLLALKTIIGTAKGAYPPGHSVQPNLMMYEVARRENLPDAEIYFNAAKSQVEWMIANLDWEDPITTKGQRVGEHITIPGLVYFLTQYPDRAPQGLREKVDQWSAVMMRRSQNMWDFRKYNDGDGWVPIKQDDLTSGHWNEPGNIAGFPACALAAAQITRDANVRQRLTAIAAAHIDDVFGRNPTGRAFFFFGPKEVEGVKYGWERFMYGIGQLHDVPFALDASPKNWHYPYNPSKPGGYTEGWIQHNTPLNHSLAWMAFSRTSIAMKDASFTRTLDVLSPGTDMGVELRAPLNLDEKIIDQVTLTVTASNGDQERITLTEVGPSSPLLRGTLKTAAGAATAQDGTLQIAPGDTVSVSYGLGYFKRAATLTAR